MTKGFFKKIFRRGGGAPAAGSAPGLPGAFVSAGPRRPPTLAETCSEIFSFVLTIRSARDLGEPAEVRQRLIRLLEKFDQEARAAGHPSPAVEGARFALIALLDEMILVSGWSGRSAWLATPLQLELLKINVAGQEFFTRLDALRKNVDENRALLEVFYDCLALGFEGRYRLLGRDKLEPLIADLSKELSRGGQWNVEDLSPAWKRPDDFPEMIGEGLPVSATLAAFIPAIILLLIIFGAVGRGAAGKTAAEIARLMTGFGR